MAGRAASLNPKHESIGERSFGQEKWNILFHLKANEWTAAPLSRMKDSDGGKIRGDGVPAAPVRGD
jgi:hypothetical protein